MQRIKPVHGLLFLDNQVRIGSGQDYVSVIENPGNKYTAFLKALRDGVTERQIQNSLELWGLTVAEVKEGIDVLNSGGYIEELVEPPTKWSSFELARYETNLNFFSTLSSNESSKYSFQQKINSTKVLLLGVGGIGSNVCLALLELGIGEIVAVDFDVVEPKNLNRQVLYTEKSIGQRKIEEARKFAAAFNSNTNFVAIDKELSGCEDALALIDKYKPDFVINVADYPTGYIDFWVNEACVKRRVPILSGGVDKKNGRSYSVVPGYSACYYCQYLNELKNNPEYAQQDKALKLQEGNSGLERYRSPNGALGPSCLQQASFISFELIRYLFFGYKSLVSFNKVCMIDYLNNNQSVVEVERITDCPVCGGIK